MTISSSTARYHGRHSTWGVRLNVQACASMDSWHDLLLCHDMNTCMRPHDGTWACMSTHQATGS